MAAAPISKRKFDVVIVGAGGSGLPASLRLARAYDEAIAEPGAYPYTR